MSKGGFTFPTAKFLPDNNKEFEAEFLINPPKHLDGYED